MSAETSKGSLLNPSTTTAGSHTSLLQKQMSFKTAVGANQIQSKADEIEVLESGHLERPNSGYTKQSAIGWICCAPCIWLRTSAAVHKIAITTATLLVTSLLVASPILFLISTAPSQLPRNCYMDNGDCIPTNAPPPECTEDVCRRAAKSIQAKLNWHFDPCIDFKNFSCSTETRLGGGLGGSDGGGLGYNRLRAVQSAQEAVDIQMQELLQHNITSGPFRKLGSLFSSCLHQTTNSTSIRMVFEQLGGYLPIGALGPSSIAPLITQIYELGPTPLIDIYYDLSYGKRPQVLLIISGPGAAAPILEHKIRWTAPKAPPYRIKTSLPKLLNRLLQSFLPSRLTVIQRNAETAAISAFIRDLNKIRAEYSRRGFWDSRVVYEISTLYELYPILNWSTLIPAQWSGPIVVGSTEYLRELQVLLAKYPTRVIHNALLLLFVLRILPQDQPDAAICTRATMWALPDITSALFLAQHTTNDIEDVIRRTDIIFKSLKAHLKRAPSLKGAALVKLSALKIQSEPWSGFSNMTAIIQQLDALDISPDNWFQNVLNIYQQEIMMPNMTTQTDMESHDAWAYPIVAKIFYDTLSHSIVVPLSVILVPYFDRRLPPYLQYASVGVAIAKEILRSITKAFEDKAIRCVPGSVNIFSNYSRMDILIHSGGMQISYHSMLSLTGPIKGMARLPGLSLTPMQIFFLVSAQELCAESDYMGIDTDAPEFEHILGWLVAQGGSATEVFKCPSGSMIYGQKTCNVL